MVGRPRSGSGVDSVDSNDSVLKLLQFSSALENNNRLKDQSNTNTDKNKKQMMNINGKTRVRFADNIKNNADQNKSRDILFNMNLQRVPSSPSINTLTNLVTSAVTPMQLSSTNNAPVTPYVMHIHHYGHEQGFHSLFFCLGFHFEHRIQFCTILYLSILIHYNYNQPLVKMDSNASSVLWNNAENAVASTAPYFDYLPGNILTTPNIAASNNSEFSMNTSNIFTLERPLSASASMSDFSLWNSCGNIPTLMNNNMQYIKHMNSDTTKPLVIKSDVNTEINGKDNNQIKENSLVNNQPMMNPMQRMNGMNSMQTLNPMQSMNDMNSMQTMHMMQMMSNMMQTMNMLPSAINNNNGNASNVNFDPQLMIQMMKNMNMMTNDNNQDNNQDINQDINQNDDYNYNDNNHNNYRYGRNRYKPRHYRKKNSNQGEYQSYDYQSPNGMYPMMMTEGELPMDVSVMDPRNLQRMHVSLSQLIDAKQIERLSRDQNGSRFIQTQLETATVSEKEGVFNQIKHNVLSLCEDVFGNYVIQKFFEHGTDNQRIELANILRGRVLPLAKSMYGCRVIQKAFTHVSNEFKILLVTELTNHVEECVRDQNGNHVIQKVIAEVPVAHISFIVDTFLNKMFHFSTHPYGCRIIQRLLEHCEERQKQPILDNLIRNTLALSKDQYGNYVIQHVLKHGPSRARFLIIQKVAQNVLAMSKHKFSSNVVEKCFIFGYDEERDMLLDEIIGVGKENSPLTQMVRDQYGNYVIQKLLEVTNVAQRNRLIKSIMELVPNLRKLMFGKHIIAKIEKITGQNLNIE